MQIWPKKIVCRNRFNLLANLVTNVVRFRTIVKNSELVGIQVVAHFSLVVSGITSGEGCAIFCDTGLSDTGFCSSGLCGSSIKYFDAADEWH